MATKSEKILYWSATGYMLLLMMMSVVSYHINHDGMAMMFVAFGYPAYLVYPLAYLKLIGIIVVITNRYNNLKDWVYATYYINMILAFVVHVVAENFYWHAVLGLICVPISYIYS
ncbi:MAG: DoxX family protein, partial [Gammaproteobacteria bacterium]|nr:DoxX family protein [Gammaproteobacteria bacterium]